MEPFKHFLRHRLNSCYLLSVLPNQKTAWLWKTPLEQDAAKKKKWKKKIYIVLHYTVVHSWSCLPFAMLHFERSKQVQTAVEQVVLKSWMTPSLQGLQGNISENTDVNLTLKALKMHWFILLGGEGPGVRITSAENIQCCSLKPPFSINSSLLGFTQDHQCILLV